MDDGVSDPLGGEKNQSQNRNCDLKTFGGYFALGDWFLAPLRGGLDAQAADFPNHKKIQRGAD